MKNFTIGVISGVILFIIAILVLIEFEVQEENYREQFGPY